MPPQQSHRLLDLFDECFGLGAHGYCSFIIRESGRNLEGAGRSVKTARPCSNRLLTHWVAIGEREIIGRRRARLESLNDRAAT